MMINTISPGSRGSFAASRPATAARDLAILPLLPGEIVYQYTWSCRPRNSGLLRLSFYVFEQTCICFYYSKWLQAGVAMHHQKLLFEKYFKVNQLFSFSSAKDRRADSRIRQKKTAQPRRESNPGSCEF